MQNKCPSCGGTLVFDADIQMMVCELCTSMFPVQEENTQTPTAFEGDQLSQDYATPEATLKNSYQEELMDVHIYECKNCGAQLAINDVEAATYCAYCGQPTIVFSRIEKRKRPQYIIPFQISKNEAISNIREKLLKSDYVSDEIKHFKPDLLRGIYIPYGMFCYEIKDRRILYAQQTDINRQKTSSPFGYHFREILARIGHIPVDASYQLSNESADRLEPFFGRDLVPFDPKYLSGYYADLRDEDFSMLKSKADRRAKDMFQEKIQTLPYLLHIKTVKSDQQFTCVKSAYTLLPVWFLVFEDDGEKYTIMVNGQTGKVVGAVPTSLRAFLKWFVISFLLIMILAVPVSLFILISGYVPYLLGIFGVSMPCMLLKGISNMKKLNKSLHLTQAKNIRNFAEERQDI